MVFGTFSDGNHTWVGINHLGHAKVGHLGSDAYYENIIAGQISVDNFIGVEVGQGKGYVVDQVYLHVEGKGVALSLEKLCQILVHQFHQ